ncbi:MAG: glycine cleavage system aminomethyltransferase GcvT [Micavibrio aeruginosavorus]|nr:glycine cleavage system aminomethyltransferase GcvT [Micavibrio aeruginosavorus]
MKTTALHAAHKALGAKMGEFAGYDMPLYYGEGVIREHEWTRSHAGLFDVSHMGQVMLTGKGACGFWEKVTPSSFSKIPDGRAKYTVLTNAQGGTIDDLIVTRLGPEQFFAVINAGRKDVDIDWLKKNLPADVTMDVWAERGLIALQGPAAEGALKDVLGIDTADMPYMWAMPVGDLMISRLGYTGEDGFEVSVPHDQAAALWDKFIKHPAVKPVGLAARDSLRLEMGYPLYGHELNEEITPVEAGLSWVIAKEHDGYIGANVVRAQLAGGAARQRVGIRLLDKGIARDGAEIRDASDKVIGVLSSGGFSPTLKQAIAMGYVPAAQAQAGQKIFVNVRGNNIAAEICDMPFVSARTKSMKKKAA